MASNTRKLKKRRFLRLKKMGVERKKENARTGTTPSQAVLFGDEKPAQDK